MKRLIIAVLLLSLGGCTPPPDKGATDVSVIGDAPRIVDPSRKPLGPASAVLLTAAAQGLVRFDASGQIIPGLAIRWAVSPDGLYYTFRIGDGQTIDAEDAARRLRAMTDPTSRNPLKAVLAVIADVVAVTPQVVEIRLDAPRPDFLLLLAQPEMALVGKAGGTGPLRIASRTDGLLSLAPAQQPDDPSADPADATSRQVRLRGERAAHAVARFVAGRVSVVLGGTFADLAVARAASLPADRLRFDPVAGLFGLAFVHHDGAIGNADNRRALAMAIDRDRLAALFSAQALRITDTLVPRGTELAAPAAPDWSGAPFALRRSAARAQIDAWRGANPGSVTLRVALPPGPGARMLFASLRADWAAIGVIAVAADDRPDLRLIDLVAPADLATWYLRRFACDTSPVCSETADTALAAARDAPAGTREKLLGDADAQLAQVTPFIALGLPVRWSLVTPRMAGFQSNARGVHPLDQLRDHQR